MNGQAAKGCSFGQHMVDQHPRYDNQLRRRRGRRKNQAMGPTGLIRPDKRYKSKYV